MIRVGVDGAPLSIRRTGVGRYVSHILLAAAATGQVRFDVLRFRPRRKVGLAAADDLHVDGMRLRTASRPVSMAFGLGVRHDLPVPLDMALPRSEVLLFTRYWHGAARRPSVSFIYDLVWLKAPESVDAEYRPRLARSAATAIRRSDAVVTISHAVETEIQEAFPEARGKTVVLPPGPTRLPPAPSDPGPVLKRLGLEPGFILHVGTLEPRKGIPVLLAASAQLPAATGERHPVVLAGGKGWSTGPIEEAIVQAGRRCRRVVGPTDEELRVLYQAAAVVVAPSLYEGFGLPVLEAMGLGVPVVCSDLPVFREVTGGWATFFRCGDADDLAAALAGLLADRRRRAELAAAGRARADAYSWEASGEGLVGALRSVRDGTPLPVSTVS